MYLNFARMGHEVVLFVPNLGGKRELPGVQFVHVPVISKKSAVTFFSFYLSLFFILAFHCLKSPPDVLYTRIQTMEWMATLLKCVFPFKYVVEVNGLAPVEMKINSVSRGWISFVTFMERVIYKLSDQVVVPSILIRDPAYLANITQSLIKLNVEINWVCRCMETIWYSWVL